VVQFEDHWAALQRICRDGRLGRGRWQAPVSSESFRASSLPTSPARRWWACD